MNEHTCHVCGSVFIPNNWQLSKIRIGRNGYCSQECIKTHRRISQRGKKSNRPNEYDVWAAMIQRCYNKNNAQFHDYGGRGISVFSEWRGVGGYDRFVTYVGKRPSPKHEIDRHPNNDGNYEPGNVRWATRREQRRNMRTNHFVEFNGRRITVSDLAEEVGISRTVLYGRLNGGWSLSDAISRPVRPRGPNKRKRVILCR